MTALEQKMVGAWNGEIPCNGRFIFHANGKYELKEYGPGGLNCDGVWKIRSDALPPTLILTCKTSEVAEMVGKTRESKLAQLDEKTLVLKSAGQNGGLSGRYTREKK